MGKTQSKPLVARHGRETAWAWQGNGMGVAGEGNGMCELALKGFVVKRYKASIFIITDLSPFSCAYTN
jgi:hypothetical protein